MAKRITDKVLLIGWSSADWYVIDPLKDKGLLPNISRLLETGARANLASIDPPIPTATWTSALTSKAPIKHEIFNLTEPGFDSNTPVSSNTKFNTICRINLVLILVTFSLKILGVALAIPAFFALFLPN